MGQQANSHRNASLNDKKQRAAGRAGRTGQSAPGQDQINDRVSPKFAKGKTGGAFSMSEPAGEHSASTIKQSGKGSSNENVGRRRRPK
jgi:hypothetical protein